MLRAVALAILLASQCWATPAKSGRVTASVTPAGDRSPAKVLIMTGGSGGGGAAAAPSWVSATLAAWMLDDAANPRVNAQGTSSRDVSNVGACLGTGPVAQSTADKMEGTASLSIPSGCIVTTDTFSGLIPPWTEGCWVKQTSGNTFLMRDFSGAAGTSKFTRPANSWSFIVTALTATTAASYPGTVWTHVIGTVTGAGNMALYVNGVSAATQTGASLTAPNKALFLGDNAGFVGLLDECFIDDIAYSAASICRVCSCGIRGEQCTCAGTAFATTGRNATNCGSCTLPADCSASAPS